jgi:hypothetical protein
MPRAMARAAPAPMVNHEASSSSVGSGALSSRAAQPSVAWPLCTRYLIVSRLTRSILCCVQTRSGPCQMLSGRQLRCLQFPAPARWTLLRSKRQLRCLLQRPLQLEQRSTQPSRRGAEKMSLTRSRALHASKGLARATILLLLKLRPPCLLRYQAGCISAWQTQVARPSLSSVRIRTS